METNVRTESFNKLYFSLPSDIRRQAVRAFQLFLSDPAHPSLRAHKLKKTREGLHLDGSISISISMPYRAIYIVDKGVNIWYWIGHKNEYATFTGKKT